MTAFRLPNFFVPGCQKSGTTYLCRELGRHPEVFLPKKKEPMFFNRTDGSDRAFNTYLDEHFAAAGDEKWVGEGSTLYLQVEKAQRNIVKRLGKDLRFIVCIRQHTEKAVSLYLHSFRMGRLRGDERITELENTSFAVSKFALCADSVARLLNRFGDQNVKVMLYDELLDDHVGFVRDALTFLDLNMVKAPEARLVNPGFSLVWDGDVLTINDPASRFKPGQVRPRFRRDDLYRLHQRFLADIKDLGDVIGRDLNDWLEFPSFSRAGLAELSRGAVKTGA